MTPLRGLLLAAAALALAGLVAALAAMPPAGRPAPGADAAPPRADGGPRLVVEPRRPDRLERLEGTGLPRRIDLASAPRRPLDRDVAAVTVRRGDRLRLVLVAADGRRQEVALPRLGRVAAGAEPPRWPVVVLAPDGRRVLVAQEGGLLVHALGAAGWRRVDTGATETAYADWAGDERVWLPYDPRSGAAPVVDLTGRAVATEDRHVMTGGRWWGATPVGPTRGAGGSFAQAWADPDRPPFAAASPDLLVARLGRDEVRVLPRPASDRTRAGAWLEDRRLLFDDGTAVLVWDVAAGEVDLLAEVTGLRSGATWTATWADLAP